MSDEGLLGGGARGVAAVAAAESGIRTRSGRVLPANAGSLEPLSGALPQHLHAQLPGALPQQLQAQHRSAAAAAGLTAGRDAATAPRGSAYAGRTVQMEVEQSRAGAPHGAGADAERWYSPAGADAGAGAAADAAARPPGAGALPPNGSNSTSSGGAAAHEDWGFGQRFAMAAIEQALPEGPGRAGTPTLNRHHKASRVQELREFDEYERADSQQERIPPARF